MATIARSFGSSGGWGRLLRDGGDFAKDVVEAVSDSEGEALMIFPGGDGPVVTKVADLARAHGWEVTGLRVERGRLDDVFREITTVPQEPAPAAA